MDRLLYRTILVSFTILSFTFMVGRILTTKCLEALGWILSRPIRWLKKDALQFPKWFRTYLNLLAD